MPWMEIAIGLVVTAIAGCAAIALSPWRETASRWVRGKFGQNGLVIHVEQDPARMALEDLSFPVQFYFSDERSVTGPPESLESWWQWAHSQGGADVERSTLLITLQATVEVAIAVDPPDVKVREISPAEGGVIRSPQGIGGGGLAPRRFTVYLDGDYPKVVYSPRPGDGRPASFSLAKGESERIQIVAEAGFRSCDWWLEIPIIVDGRPQAKRVGSARKPFRTISKQGKRLSMYCGDPETGLSTWSEPRLFDSDGS